MAEYSSQFDATNAEIQSLQKTITEIARQQRQVIAELSQALSSPAIRSVQSSISDLAQTAEQARRASSTQSAI